MDVEIKYEDGDLHIGHESSILINLLLEFQAIIQKAARKSVIQIRISNFSQIR